MNKLDTFTNLKTKLYQIVSQSLSIPQIIVTPDLSYQSIAAWDSIGHVNLMLDLQKHFSIDIEQNKILKLVSVREIEKYLLKTLMFEDNEECTTNGNSKIIIHRGLNNIYFDKTTISHIDEKKGKLSYRGYLIKDVIKNFSFEETAYLIIYNHIPTQLQLLIFKAQLEKSRNLPEEIISLIKVLSKKLSCINLLITAISALAELICDNSIEDQIIAYMAKIPLIIGVHRVLANKKNLPVIPKDISHAKYILLMILGFIPDDETVNIFETIMILQAEHDANASAFSARIAISTETNVGSAITAAVSVFSGKLHGGALIGVMEMLAEIEKTTDTKAYINNRIRNKMPIFGFGHRVYSSIDPRSIFLKQTADILSHKYQNKKWLRIIEEIKNAMSEHMKYGININVDFYTCVCYLILGIQKEFFIPIFVSSRIVGWGAHIIEQNKNNILIRPRLKYTGKLNKKIRQTNI